MQIVKEEIESVLDEEFDVLGAQAQAVALQQGAKEKPKPPKWAKEYDEKMASGKWAGSWEEAGSGAAWGRKERSPEYKKQKEKGVEPGYPSHLLKGPVPFVRMRTPGKWVDTSVKESNMKLTKTKLMQIIQEEIEGLLQENEKVRSAAAEVSPHAKRIGGVPDAATLLAKALDDTNLPDDNAKMAAADLTLTTLAQRQDDQSAEVQRAQKAQG